MIKGLPRAAKQDEWVAIDTEFFGQDRALLHRPHGTFACATFSYGRGETYLIDNVPDLRRALQRVDDAKWIMHNLLYDVRQMRALSEIRQRPIWDSMLVDQGLWGGWYPFFSLADLHARYFGKPMAKDVRSQFGERSSLTNEMKRYAAADALATYRVAMAQMKEIESEDIEMRHYHEADHPTAWALLDMDPVRIDVDGWIKLAKTHARKGAKIEEQLGFNVGSADQTKPRIEDMIGEPIKNTNKQDTLLPLVRRLRAESRDKEREFIEKIIEGRMYRKLAESYGQNWVDQYIEPGGIMHGDWKDNGTETRRIVCKNPPLQTVPVRELIAFRKLFISKYPGGMMTVADKHQQEPMILAWLTGDERLRYDLLEANNGKGEDLHARAAKDFGLASRAEGKSVNLGLNYSMSPFGLARRTGLTTGQARRGIQARNVRWPDVYQWNQRMVSQARALGYVKSAMGCRGWVNPFSRGEQWKRNAVNIPVQMSAAEDIKTWMSMIHRECKTYDLPFRVVLPIHDELVSDTEPGVTRHYSKMMRELGIAAGEAVIPGFPMKIEIARGDSWGAKGA